jgi:tRNA1(Val) A37 N6-methylase TrmN6
VIPLLLSTRTKANIVGVEIQEKLYDMARRNVALNGLENQIDMVWGDLRTFHSPATNEMFDLVTVNPPYLPAHAGLQNMNPYVAAARHELYCTLEDVLLAASKLVRFGGKVAMVHRPSRLADIITGMRSCHIEPKRLRFVHPRKEEEANMVLIEGIKGGGAEIRLLPPLIVYDDNNEYCQELLEIYYGAASEG